MANIICNDIGDVFVSSQIGIIDASCLCIQYRKYRAARLSHSGNCENKCENDSASFYAPQQESEKKKKCFTVE